MTYGSEGGQQGEKVISRVGRTRAAAEAADPTASMYNQQHVLTVGHYGFTVGRRNPIVR